MGDDDNKYGGFGGQLSGGVSYGSPAQAPEPTPNQSQASTAADALLDIAPQSHGPVEVKDITTAQFRDEVIAASTNLPVLVDFWAPWCGPCKQLAPALESAVAKAAGRVKLVKMNIDDHPEVAGQMGIQSIPAVVAFVDGQPKDAFMGNKSEVEIERFIEKIAGPSGPSPLDEALEQAAEFLANDEPDQAAQIYGAILAQQADNLDALAGYGMSLLKLDDLEGAERVVSSLPETTDHPQIEALRASYALQLQAGELGDLSELNDKVSKNPKDHDARFDLAIALNGLNRREEAADQLLEIISRDRNWRDDGAKAQLLQFFEAWGPTDPATLSARRRLSSLLFS